MKKSLLFVAVASIFALASCGEKAAETTTVDTTAAVVDTTAAIDTAAAADTTAAAADTAAAAH